VTTIGLRPSTKNARRPEAFRDGRLVCASPVPLNEEQRKVLAALRQGQCRFFAIEGPPGCGKCHTIVAPEMTVLVGGLRVRRQTDQFGSTVDALRCASTVQTQMAERNAAADPADRIEWRIGIHQGDIVVEDGAYCI